MAVSLKKGTGVNLNKISNDSDKNTLEQVVIGLGWDEAEKPALFSSRGGKTEEIDCDASAILCGSNGKLLSGKALAGPNKLDKDIVYFGNLQHYSGCVRHGGDNLIGGGDGDSEQIFIDLKSLPSAYKKIVFIVNIYEAYQKKQHFGLVKNAYIRILNSDTKEELCRYDLTDGYDGYTAMIFGELVKDEDGWTFKAIGEGTKDVGILHTVKKFE